MRSREGWLRGWRSGCGDDTDAHGSRRGLSGRGPSAAAGDALKDGAAPEPSPVPSRRPAGLGGVTSARCWPRFLSRCLLKSLGSTPPRPGMAKLFFRLPGAGWPPRSRRGRAPSTPQPLGSCCKTAPGGKIPLSSPVPWELPPARTRGGDGGTSPPLRQVSAVFLLERETPEGPAKDGGWRFPKRNGRPPSFVSGPGPEARAGGRGPGRAAYPAPGRERSGPSVPPARSGPAAGSPGPAALGIYGVVRGYSGKIPPVPPAWTPARNPPGKRAASVRHLGARAVLKRCPCPEGFWCHQWMLSPRHLSAGQIVSEHRQGKVSDEHLPPRPTPGRCTPSAGTSKPGLSSALPQLRSGFSDRSRAGRGAPAGPGYAPAAAGLHAAWPPGDAAPRPAAASGSRLCRPYRPRCCRPGGCGGTQPEQGGSFLRNEVHAR